ncbi:hypothetical protein BD779DRAFT_1476174 [Infundibulicybe gibba]|nr:hypothetical protein BD779DRAFT_1476174 [Infundibulicybe gibba]
MTRGRQEARLELRLGCKRPPWVMICAQGSGSARKPEPDRTRPHKTGPPVSVYPGLGRVRSRSFQDPKSALTSQNQSRPVLNQIRSPSLMKGSQGGLGRTESACGSQEIGDADLPRVIHVFWSIIESRTTPSPPPPGSAHPITTDRGWLALSSLLDVNEGLQGHPIDPTMIRFGEELTLGQAQTCFFSKKDPDPARDRSRIRFYRVPVLNRSGPLSGPDKTAPDRSKPVRSRFLPDLAVP